MNDPLKPFKDIARNSTDVNEFIAKVREIKDVSPRTAKLYRDAYDGGDFLSTATNFFNTYKSK